MYDQWYHDISAPFRSPGAHKAINVLDKGLVVCFAVAFAAAAAVLAFTGDGRAVRFIVVPAATFALVTIARNLIDAPRPYELVDIDPIIVKDTHGKSMPSRHIASAVIIAFALCWLSGFNALADVACILACAALAFCRIVGGVHFPRDVIAAIAVAFACGLIGFILIP